MKKIILFAVFLSPFLSAYCKAEDNPRLDLLLSMIKPTVLKLQVIPTRSHPLIYELTRGSKIELKITQYEGLGGYEWGNIEREYIIPIKLEENKKILDLLHHALELTLRDETMGMDGSIWILESKLYQPLKITIWSPEYKMVSRGYENLVKLEKYLKSLNEKYYTKNKS